MRVTWARLFSWKWVKMNGSNIYLRGGYHRFNKIDTAGRARGINVDSTVLVLVLWMIIGFIEVWRSLVDEQIGL